jgi:hypothetical protein
MIIFLIVVNLSITLLNLYLALKICKLRQILMQVTEAFDRCQKNARIILYLAPKLLRRSQNKIYLCKQKYQRFQLQIEQIRKIFIFLLWLFRMYQRQSRLRPL